MAPVAAVHEIVAPLDVIEAEVNAVGKLQVVVTAVVVKVAEAVNALDEVAEQTVFT